MAGPDSLGASGKFIVIDLVAAVFPLLFMPLFAARYPDDRRFDAQAVSRAIVASAGSGEITLLDTRGQDVDWTMAAGEYNSVQATGIAANPGTITEVKVFL